MENQAHMEVNLDEGRTKKRGQIPWEPVKPSKQPTYKDPVKISLFISDGSGSLMKGVEDSPAPEAFDWRVNRKLMSRKERKYLQRFTGIKFSGKKDEPLRVYDEDDGPLKLTKKEMRERKKRENMDAAEAMERSIEDWQKNHPGVRAFFRPKEWKNSPVFMRLRQALGLPLFSPEEAAVARERAMIEAAKRAARDYPVCHPLCLFGVSPSARALADAEADLRAKMGVVEQQLCRALAAQRCGLRQRSQATVAEESLAIERERRRRRKGQQRSSDESSEREREGECGRGRGRSRRRRGSRCPGDRRGWDEDEEDVESARGRRGRRRRHDQRSRGKGRATGGSQASLASSTSGRSERSKSPGWRRERQRERRRQRERERERQRGTDDVRRSSSPYHRKCTEPGTGSRGPIIRRCKPSKH